MHHIIITPGYGKTAITKRNAIFYYFCHYVVFKNKQSHTPLLYARLLKV